MRFTKMQGCGNDYIYVDGSSEEVKNKPEVVRRLSDRHFGIGGDGVIFINPSDNADFEMEMYNADGSRGKMCGNGIRCVAKFVYDKGLSRKNPLKIESFGSVKTLYLNIKDDKVDTVRVDMGEPILKAADVPVDPSKTLGFTDSEERLISAPIKYKSEKFMKAFGIDKNQIKVAVEVYDKFFGNKCLYFYIPFENVDKFILDQKNK